MLDINVRFWYNKNRNNRSRSMDKKRIAVYTRIGKNSPDEEDKRKQYFTDLIAAREDCELVDIYVDAFGTSAMDPTRPAYVKLLADAENKKFDYIVVKQISEFSRDSKETQRVVNRLRELNIGLYFIDINECSTNSSWDKWFAKATGKR